MLPAGGVTRVAVDARPLNVPHLRGMGKYVAEVLSRIDRSRPVRWELLSNRPDWPLHAPALRDAREHLFECRGDRLHAWEQLALPWKAKRVRAELLHCVATTLPWWQPVPTVVTLHDAIPWVREEPGWPDGPYKNALLPSAFRRCAAVITISEASRCDIVRLWPGLARKTVVIPHGIGDAYLDVPAGTRLGETLERAGVRPPYFLYLGGELPRKRPDWAVRLFAALGDSRAQLVMGGIDPAARERILAPAPPEVRGRIVCLPFVPEAEMPALFLNAVAVLYPTLYEGFGLPALEAQATGTPVLLSPLGSLAELLGPAAVVLSPDDFDGWLAAVRLLLAKRGPAPTPDAESRAWARGFSWEVCARRHWEVYRRVLARRAKARPAPVSAGCPV